MLGGELDWTRGDLTFTWIPGYVYLDSAPDYWLGTIRARLTAHYNQLSNELRVAGTSGDRVEWVGGLHAYEVRNDGYLALFTNQPFQFRQSNITGNQLEGYAAFGEWRYRATDRMRLTAGARASTTRREGRGFTSDRLGSLPYSFARRFDNLDWKLGVERDVAPDWNVAAGYGQERALAAGALQWRLDGRYESEWWADYLQNRGVRQGPSLKADVSLGWRSPAGWTVTAWARNVTNEAVLAATAAAGIPGPATAYLEPPRTYGLRLTADF